MLPATAVCPEAGSVQRLTFPGAKPAAPKIQQLEEPRIEPPRAKRDKEPVVHKAHDDERPDYYHWMRKKEEDPDFIPYLESWNEYTNKTLEKIAPLTEKVSQEIASRIDRDFESVPFKIGPYLYYKRYEGVKEYPIHCRRPAAGGPEEVVIDGNLLSQDYTYFKIKSYSPSNDGRYVAFAIDSDGSQFGDIHIKDMITGKILYDEKLTETDNDLEWTSDSKGFWYVKTDKEKRPYQVAFHHVGTPVSTDQVLFTELNVVYDVILKSDKFDRNIFIISKSKNTTEIAWTALNSPGAPLHVIHPRQEGFRYYIAPGDTDHYFLTNNGNENTALYRASSLVQSKSEWTLVEPARADADIDSILLFKNYLVAQKRVQGLTRLEVRDLATGQTHTIPIPQDLCTAAFYNNMEFESDRVTFKFHSPITPPSVFQYDIKARRLDLLQQHKAGGFNPSLYHIERIWATARDGTQVPISIFHKKGIVRDGSAPLRMLGYGAYGITTDPYFSRITASYLERGVICAIAHVRGSGDLGYTWYQDGYLLKKMNTFTDFIDCAEHLIRQGYTSPDRFAIHGGSAGGLLMGVVVNMRPDLFKVCVADVPFVDAVTTMFDETLPLTREEWKEWGNPNEKDFYDLLKAYSPYDNIPVDQKNPVITIPAVEPPALFIKTGLHDNQVSAHEPAKYVAKMMHYKTLFNRNKNPLLFQINMDAGHDGDPGRFSGFKELAPMHAFVLDQLGFKA